MWSSPFVWMLVVFFLDCQAQGPIRRRAGHRLLRTQKAVISSGGLSSDLEKRLTYNYATYFIPLDKNWNNKTLDAPSIERPFPGLIEESLVWDEDQNIVYTFNGQLSSNGGIQDPVKNLFFANRSLPQTMWSLDMTKDQKLWTQVYGLQAGKEYPPGIKQSVSLPSASDRENAYYIGAAISSWSSPTVENDTKLRNIPGFMTFNFEKQTLTNSTNDGNYFASRYTGPNDTFYLPGNMYSAPFGPKGLLILVGGRFDDGWQYLTIFDKDSKNWYKQQLTGDVPLAYRSHSSYCVFSAVDKVHQTMEIFFYGTFTYQATNDTVYSLTLPAMVWHHHDFTSQPRRDHMECVGTDLNNQAILVGGFDPDQNVSDAGYSATEDPWEQGIGVFDMTNILLKDEYSADAPEYVGPKIVREQYENVSRYPPTWASNEVQAIFENWNLEKENSTSSYHSRHSPTIIAGSVVGGIVFIGIIIGISFIWFCMVKRKKTTPREVREHHSNKPQSDQNTMLPPKNHSISNSDPNRQSTGSRSARSSSSTESYTYGRAADIQERHSEGSLFTNPYVSSIKMSGVQT